MQKTTNPFDSVNAAATSRQKATRYVTPDGKERHVDENLRNAFDYLITRWDGTVSSGKMNMVHVGDWQTNLDYLSARLFYCTDEMPPDVVELLGPSTSTSTSNTRFMVIHTPPQRTRSLKSLFFETKGNNQ